MKIGFKGARGGMTLMQKVEVGRILAREFDWHQGNEAHHGGCKGADDEFDDICFKLNHDTPLKVVCVVHSSNLGSCRGDWHLPALEVDGRSPSKRNLDIVDAVDLMVVAPVSMHEVLRSEVWACIRYARKRGREIFIVYPDGIVVGEG